MKVTEKMISKMADDIRKLKESLEEILEAKQGVLDNAENADRPNEERIEKLNNQVSILEEARDNLDYAIDGLEGWE